MYAEIMRRHIQNSKILPAQCTLLHIDINVVLKVKNSIGWGRIIHDQLQKNAQQFTRLFKAWSFYFEKGQLDMQEEQQFKFDFQKPFRAMFSGMFAVPWDVLVLCSRMMHEFRKASILKLVSKELQHLAAILQHYAGCLIFMKQILFFSLLIFKKKRQILLHF